MILSVSKMQFLVQFIERLLLAMKFISLRVNYSH